MTNEDTQEDDESLVPVFMPALAAVLIFAEDRKEEPLTYDEVIRIRDGAHCTMMRTAEARKLYDERGEDIDPENCWHDWQHLRRALGRKPDLDPGPKLNLICGDDPEYLQTIRDAHGTLHEFRELLNRDDIEQLSAMVKTEVVDGKSRAFMWLANPRITDAGFAGEFFEVSEAFQHYEVGDELEFAEDALLDWMVIDDGVLRGGYSLRYYRSTLSEAEHADYDAYIGVEKYG